MLENYKPQNVFVYFEEICKIPHGSHNTKAISDYVVSVAKEHNLRYIQDDVNNVIIFRDGSKGCEDKPAVMLQGHLDMVCEKNFETDAKFDFEKDSLKLDVMDDFVIARGTTLGGDDGIGVAYMLALLTDDSIVIPPLECVFTVDEEVGMDGAHALDVSPLKARMLINLDHEDEGCILTSCAGGRSTVLSLPVCRTNKSGIKYKLVICGLLGGHSGTEINKYRGNANLIMGRLLHFLSTKISFDILNITGGLQDNAIPRECNAEIIVPSNETENFESYLAEFEETIKNEYRTVEKNMMVYCENVETCSADVLTEETKNNLIFLLMTLPDGVQRMSPDTKDLVQTSSNVGIIKLTKDIFEVYISVRSSVSSEKEALCTKIKFLTETIGGTYLENSDYPAWEYKSDSKLREITVDSFRKVYNSEPVIMGIHAGLETGVFYNKIKGLDIVVIGPEVDDIHTPKERLYIPSVGRVWELILDMLRTVAES